MRCPVSYIFAHPSQSVKYISTLRKTLGLFEGAIMCALDYFAPDISNCNWRCRVGPADLASTAMASVMKGRILASAKYHERLDPSVGLNSN